MEAVIRGVFSAAFLYSALRVTTPILFAALGGAVAKKAGVTNIGLEGTMLASALAGVVGSAYTQSLLIGALCGIATGLLISGLLAYFAIKLKAEIFLTGLMMNMIASGATVFIMYMLTKDKGTTTKFKSLVFPQVPLPLIKDIPFVGEVVSNHNILTYLAFLSVALVWFFINRTKLGIRIRAVGENPKAAESVGINIIKTQVTALLICGFLASLGGMYLSMGYVSWFSRDMTAGRGFTAVAAQYLGRANAGGTLMASLVFGTADALANVLQSLRVPAEFVQMIPYAATLLGLVFYSVNAKRIRRLKKLAK
ncbi:ABC transporter permease [Lachnoclostridium pacaense]|uniref:ABC transporter permease n=1 Tax=Enterocloster hominis (ex Hitch et al. 2024) TaxID=1917870 RepID=UPI001D10D78C|nr:ABC transporter permease [Lachnoclostridium pacaense]MCC2877705.1 ABC transporter permease [Lachnoclostridium pacaense]